MAFDFGNLLKQYLGSSTATDPAQAERDFGQVALHAPSPDLAQGVTQAFRSDQTPPFAQMVSQLFSQGDSGQRAGMLNQLLSNVNPAVLASLTTGIGNLLTPGAGPAITPEQAQQVTTAQVQQIAATVEQHDPSVVDKMGTFYAEHPTLVKTMGGIALAIVMNRMAVAK
jgi:hypothetical protein